MCQMGQSIQDWAKKICWRENLKNLKEYDLLKEERGKCCIFPVQILCFYELAFFKIL